MFATLTLPSRRRCGCCSGCGGTSAPPVPATSFWVASSFTLASSHWDHCNRCQQNTPLGRPRDGRAKPVASCGFVILFILHPNLARSFFSPFTFLATLVRLGFILSLTVPFPCIAFLYTIAGLELYLPFLIRRWPANPLSFFSHP